MSLELWKQSDVRLLLPRRAGVNVPSRAPPPNSHAGTESTLYSLLSSIREGAGGFARKETDTEIGQRKLMWHKVTQRVPIGVFLERSSKVTGVARAETSERGSPEHGGIPWPRAWNSVLETLIQCLSFKTDSTVKTDFSRQYENKL